MLSSFVGAVKFYFIILLAVIVVCTIVSLITDAAHSDMVMKYGYDPMEDPQGRTIREQLQDKMRTGTEKEKRGRL